jgi:fructose-1,6-bisphosphatase/inositol monophosphatase family enzyme
MRPAATRLPPDDIARLLARALDLADESRRLIRASVQSGFRVERKPDQSFVTSTDVAVEARLRELIALWFPEHGVIGEEQSAHRPDADFQWILDPVDGTEEFVRGIPTYGTIIGLHWRGEPLAGVLDFPALDLRVHAALGHGCFRNGARVRLSEAPGEPPGREALCLSARANFTRHRDDGAIFDALTRAFPNHRIYRSCLNHALAATGMVAVAVAWHERAWDLAAARILTEEAGGVYRTVSALDADDGGKVYCALFGNPATVERAAQVID